MDNNPPTKADEVIDVGLQLLDSIPPHVRGWCNECDSEVWVDAELAWGPAESCEEHEPLCHFQDGGCSGA